MGNIEERDGELRMPVTEMKAYLRYVGLGNVEIRGIECSGQMDLMAVEKFIE